MRASGDIISCLFLGLLGKLGAACDPVQVHNHAQARFLSCFLGLAVGR